jgi:hypothetical protein
MARNAKNFKELLEPTECQGERVQVFEGTPPWPEADGKPLDHWVRRWVQQCLDGGERPALALLGLKGDPSSMTGLNAAAPRSER